MEENYPYSKHPQKHKHSSRLRTNLGAVENPQGSVSQPIEVSSPGSEQNL